VSDGLWAWASEGEGDEGFYVVRSGRPANLHVSSGGSEAVVCTSLGAGLI
jgi:hypothetical protein